ncbi:MAG: PAS domain-containing protein, partial [Peptostreptococcus anaerobius]
MNLQMLEKIIRNIDNPAIIFDKKRNLISKNKQFDQVYEVLNIATGGDLSKVELEMRESNVRGTKGVRIKDTNLIGREHKIVSSDGEKYYLYIFNRLLILDDLISNVIEHIDEIVVLFDENGTLRKMNAICDELLPFKRKDVLRKNINELVGMDLVENPIIIEMIEKKEKVYREIVYPDGRVISYTAIPIIDKDSTFRGGILTGRDVSRLLNIAKKGSSKKIEVTEYISKSHEIDK